MKKLGKVLSLCMALFMVMQVILPTISQAVETVKLNIQPERPYNTNNDDDDEYDIYKLARDRVNHTIFKIGEVIDDEGNLDFETAYAYYCLRGNLGFGDSEYAEEISKAGVAYRHIAYLEDKDLVMSYFKDTIGYDISEANYNSIYWIVDNMYLPKAESAEALKTDLLKNVHKYAEENGMLSLGENMLAENSLLTDDDIEVVQQIALWYFTNNDQKDDTTSVVIPDEAILSNLLTIDDAQPDNDTTVSYNKNRAKQINTLYRYFVDNAKVNSSGIEQKIPERLELDKTLEPTIETKTVPGTSLEAYVVGPFKINETQKGNTDYTFSYELKYKTSETQEDWTKLEIDNTMGTVYLSDEKGTVLDRTKNIEDMIAGESFYITMLKDILDISSMAEFALVINYDPCYYTTTAEVLAADAEDQPVLKVEKEKEDPLFDTVFVKVEKKEFDLALRKFITGINGEEITDRVPTIYIEGLREAEATTAKYEHTKDPIYLKIGDTIVYTIRIYNEGDLNGYAKVVTDYLCDGLEFVEDSELNQEYGWELAEDGKTLTTNYLANTLINAYDRTKTSETIDRDENWQKAEDGTDGLYYADLQIECKIKDTATVGITLPNVAEISEDLSEGTTDEPDRDSDPDTLTDDDVRNYENDPWYEDDDDYERVIIEPEKVFDLALRKYISNIERKGEEVDFASRVPEVDTTPLTQNKSTANYIHPKDVLTVKQGDIITYKLRIYNEGELDGYATEITDYIPEGLGLLVGYSGNSSWSIKSESVNSQALVGENGWYKTEEDVPTNALLTNEDLSNITIVTGKEGLLKITDAYSLKEELIKKYGAEEEDGDLFQVSTNSENDGLFYQEIEVTCIVLAPNTYEGIITNVAEISADKAVEITVNENNEEVETEVNVEDRDSRPGNVYEDGKYAPGTEENGYTPGEQDDDDFEPVQLKYFDLALRKFITGVNEAEVDTRIPKPVIDEEGNITYEHPKTPVEVVDNDNVTYTIRVYNEGTIAGYAQELEDDIPEGLIFLPEDETNKAYGWKMYYYDEEGSLVETEKVEEATVIRTTYLSEENGEIVEETGKNTNLLEAFNRETIKTPNFRDVKVVFKVSQKDIPEENEDGIIINKAHITEDSDDDEDSTPDEWNEGEDDQNKEYIYVQKFDLALFKWVSKTIVTVDGKTTTTETGFKPNIGETEATGEDYRDNEEEEPIASVTINKKKLNSTTVKFVYNIKVVNEGDIAGFATEVTDYIPEGLKFVAEDNPQWTLEENGKITTRALETTLLEPGESAEVQVTFTWINDANNLGLKTNIAAITEDYNEKGVQDEDSDPGNEDIQNYEEEQEDDDDFALVILTPKTGKAVSYIWLILLTITIISAGAISIKKYVL